MPTDLFDQRVARRAVLRNLAVLAGLGAAGSFARSATALAAESKRTRIILLGTQSGPNVNLLRGETAALLLVDNEPYLIDCGYGTLRALVASKVGYSGISNIFLTHLHDDHVADLPALLSHQWTRGRTKPTAVRGPYGTEALVDAALAFGRPNEVIRTIDEGRSIRQADLFNGIDLDATVAPNLAFRDERVTVRTIENTHFPLVAKEKMPHRALSYRFDTPGRSVVFSGDTTYSPGLVKLAEGADVFVCEVTDLEGQKSAFAIQVKNGAYPDGTDTIWRHIMETHSATEQTGRMAAEAGVKTLVLYHLAPGASQTETGIVPDEAYIKGVRKHFSGEIIVGRDLMEI